MRILVRLAIFLGCMATMLPANYKPGDKLEINWGGQWYPGEVLEVKDGNYKVRYDGYGAAWDEWASAERLRGKATAVATEQVAAGYKPGERVEGKSFGMWFKGTVTGTEGGKVKVKFDSGTEEALPPDRVRHDATAAPRAQPVAGTRPAGAKAGIEGAFLRVETFYLNGGLTLSNQAWFFTKDGRFSKAPAGGFSFKDFAVKAPTDGSYWIDGGKITLAYADGSAPVSYDFKDKGDELVWGGLGSSRVEGFRKGWRFDGEYEGGASIGGGAVMASSTLVFRRDGTFARESVANVSGTSDRSVVTAGTTGASAGTYEFDGFTLTLRSNGEPARSYTVLAFGDKDEAGRPEYLYRDGTMMRRQK
ncbi:MAG: hypothetical protein KIT44_15515 [Opitutaceae bacterium]|nr:hypothetical protein [Opitutaceae bacterium]